MAGLDRRRRRGTARPRRAAVVGRPARCEPRAHRAVRHGRIEPRAARDRRAARQPAPARARLDRPGRRARRAGGGLALRDRVQVGLDDGAQLLRRRVLGQDRRRRLALRRDHRPGLVARGARAQRRLGAHRARAPRRRRPLLRAHGVRARARRARGHRPGAAPAARRRGAREVPRRVRHQPRPDARARDRRQARQGPRQADVRAAAGAAEHRAVARAADRRVDGQAGHRRAPGRRRAAGRSVRLRRRPALHPPAPGRRLPTSGSTPCARPVTPCSRCSSTSRPTWARCSSNGRSPRRSSARRCTSTRSTSPTCRRPRTARSRSSTASRRTASCPSRRPARWATCSGTPSAAARTSACRPSWPRRRSARRCSTGCRDACATRSAAP